MELILLEKPRQPLQTELTFGFPMRLAFERWLNESQSTDTSLQGELTMTCSIGVTFYSTLTSCITYSGRCVDTFECHRWGLIALYRRCECAFVSHVTRTCMSRLAHRSPSDHCISYPSFWLARRRGHQIRRRSDSGNPLWSRLGPPMHDNGRNAARIGETLPSFV